MTRSPPTTGRRPLVFALVLLCSLLRPVHSICDLYAAIDGRGAAANSHLPNCTAFRSRGCCTSHDVVAVMGALPPLYSPKNADCQEHMNYFNCFFCAPHSGIGLTSKVINTNMCNLIYNDCRDAYINNQRIGEFYSSGTDFCMANGWTTTTSTSAFGYSYWQVNSASSTTISGFVALITLASTVLLAMDGDSSEEENLSADKHPTARPSARRTQPRCIRRSALSHVAVFSVLATALLVPSVSAQDQFCPAYNNRAPAPRQELYYGEVCRGFHENACCFANEIASAQSSLPFLPDASDKCKSWMSHLGCYPCSPKQNSFYDRLTQTVTVCERTCDAVYSACSGAFYKTDRLDRVFGDGREFCESLTFEVVSGTSGCYDTDYFADAKYINSAGTVSPSLLAPLASIAVLAHVLYSGSSFAESPSGSSRPLPRSSSGFRRHTSSLHTALTLVTVVSLALPAIVSAQFNTATQSRINEYLSEQSVTFVSELMQPTSVEARVAAANTSVEAKDPVTSLEGVTENLAAFFSDKETLVRALEAEVRSTYTDTSLRSANPTFVDADFMIESGLTLEYDERFGQRVNFSSSAVKMSDDTRYLHREEMQAASTSGSVVRETISYSKSLDSLFMSNAQSDPGVRWQYFGSAEGVFRQYPAVTWSRSVAGIPTDYDPRTRPWYAEASTGPKDIVLSIDCSGSMGRVSNMVRSVAKTILSSLTREDYVNVICARGSPAYNGRGTALLDVQNEVFGCSSTLLSPATTSVKAILSERIDLITFIGGDNAAWSIRTAREMLVDNAASRPNCVGMVVHITDSHSHDAPCTPGREVCSQNSNGGGQSCTWEEPPACNWATYPTTRWTTAEDEARTLASHDIPVYTINVGRYSDRDDLGTLLSCLIPGMLQTILEPLAIRSQLIPYFQFVESRSRPSTADPVFTAPYIDSSGLGLIMTVAMPVYDTGSPEGSSSLIGVVGIDITLEEMENAVAGLSWGTVYTFMTNRLGDTLVHPNLRASTELTGDPVYPDIETLETVDGDPADFISLVRPDLIAGVTNSRDITDAKRLVPRGDPDSGFVVFTQDSRYVYRPIGSQFMVGLVAQIPRDISFHTLKASPTVRLDTIFHRLDLYQTSDPTLYASLDVVTAPADDDLRPGLTYSRARSAVKLAPRSYCKPAEYMTDVQDSDFADIISFLNTSPRPPNFGCFSSGSLLEFAVRGDISVIDDIETVWKARSSEHLGNVIWTYIGSPSGTFRVFPGTRVTHDYDPTSRPWYARAITNIGKAAASSPYLDAFGAGKIVTISKAILQPADSIPSSCSASPNIEAGCPCTENDQCASGECSDSSNQCLSSQVQYVVGIDFQYNTFQNVIEGIVNDALDIDSLSHCNAEYSGSAPNARTGGTTTTTLTTLCYLLDTAGHLVTDPSFQAASPGDEYAYTEVPLGRKHGEIMADLLAKGIFTRSVRSDPQGVCRNVHPWLNVAATTKGLAATVDQEEDLKHTRGLFAPFTNEFICLKESVSYSYVEDNDRGVVTDTIQGACSGGTYYLSRVTGSSFLSLTIVDYYDLTSSLGPTPTCAVLNLLYASGSFRNADNACNGGPSSPALPTCGIVTPVGDIATICESGAAVASPSSMLILAVAAVVASLSIRRH